VIDLFKLRDLKNIPLDKFLGNDYKERSIGFYFFADGSIGFIIEVNGDNLYNYSDDDLYAYYQKVVFFLNKTFLQKAKKGVGATYQFIYTPEFNYDDFIKRIMKTNFFKFNEESYSKYKSDINSKITDITNTLSDLEIFINDNSQLFSDSEKKEFKKEIVKLKFEYNEILKNMISSSSSIKYLEKFFDALNLRTVELMQQRMLGRVKRHKYYLTCRYYPDYKNMNLKTSDIKDSVDDIINYEDKEINKFVFTLFSNVVNHAIFLNSSLPFGGRILNLQAGVNFLYRYMGMPPLMHNSESVLSRLFPYEMDIDADRIIVYDVPNSPVPFYDKFGDVITKNDGELSDIVLNLFSASSLPDPGTANISTGVSFLDYKGDYSVTWSIFREHRLDTRKRINTNKRVFNFLTDIPFFSKRLFTEEGLQIKQRMFKFAMYNLEMGELGDFYQVAIHLLLRKAVQKSEVEKIRTSFKDIENNKGSNVYQKEDIKKELKEVYTDSRVFTVNTDYFRKIGGGITAISERDSTNTLMFMSAYPLSFYGHSLLERYLPVYSTSLAATMPFHKEPEGMATAGLLLETPTGLYNHNHFALPGAKNFVTIGATGSGKTFFEVNRLISMFKNGARLIFVDRGAALYRAVKFLNGQNIKLRMTSKSEFIKDKLNPFVIAEKNIYDSPEDYDEYLQQIREFLVTLLCSIAGMETDNIAIRYFTELIDDELIHGFERNLIKTPFGNSAQITFTNIYDYLDKRKSESGWSEFLANGAVLSSVRNFTKHGLYGALFDGLVEKPLIVSPAVAIDFEGLESEKVSQVALAIVNSYIWNVVLGTGGFVPELGKSFRQTNVDFDEVWATLKSKIGQITLETGARTFRKHGAGLGLLSQSAADIGESPISSAILANIQHIFAMSAKEGDIMNYKKYFGFSDNELVIIQRLRYQYGLYNELYYKCLDIQNKHLTTKLRLRPLPLTYAIVSSDPTDKVTMEYLSNKFMDICKDSENIAYMKSVLVFSRIFPNGVEAYPRYQEIISKVGNNLQEFINIIIEENHIKFNEINLENELFNISFNVNNMSYLNL
jgi:hypothetical protein